VETEVERPFFSKTFFSWRSHEVCKKDPRVDHWLRNFRHDLRLLQHAQNNDKPTSYLDEHDTFPCCEQSLPVPVADGQHSYTPWGWQRLARQICRAEADEM
jgi:hypothetical protein